MFIPVHSNEDGTATKAQIYESLNGSFWLEVSGPRDTAMLLIANDEDHLPQLCRDISADLTTLAAQIESRLPKTATVEEMAEEVKKDDEQ